MTKNIWLVFYSFVELANHKTERWTVQTDREQDQILIGSRSIRRAVQDTVCIARSNRDGHAL